MKRRYLLSLLPILGALSLTGCFSGKKSGGGSSKDTSTITRVSLDKSSETLDIGANFTVTATVEGTGAYSTNVKWEQSVAGIVTITSGNTITVTAQKEGDVVLTARSTQDESKYATLSVHVNQYIPATITSVSLSSVIPQEIEVGNTFSITATVQGTGAFNTNVAWTSSQQGVISFTSGNTITVTGVTAGTTILTATSVIDETKSASVSVIVTEPTPVPTVTKVTLSPSTHETMLVGDSFELTATVEGTGDYDQTVTWSDNNSGIISYGTGNKITVTACKAGTVKLTAKSNQDSSKSRYINLTVEDIPEITGISLDKGDSTMEVGESLKVKATVTGKGSFNQNVIWSLDQTGIVSKTDSNATTITALTVGQVKLTATAVGDSKYKASMTINVVGNFDLNHPMTYQKVTDLSQLSIGDYYIVVTSSKDKAMGVSNQSSGHPSAVDITKGGDLAKNIVGSSVQVLRLEEGLASGSYALKYKSLNSSKNGLFIGVDEKKTNEIVDLSTKTRAASWNIEITSGVTTIETLDTYTFKDYPENAYIRQNGSSAIYGAYRSAAVALDVDLYKYSSGKEYLAFSCGAETTLSTNVSLDVSVSVHGFTPTEFAWSTSNDSRATVVGNGVHATISTKSEVGDVTITCAATEGSLTISENLVVHITQYTYDTISDGQYAFASGTHYLNPETGEDAETFDASNPAQYFTLSKAYAGNNTFYVTNGSQYLVKHSSKARVTLSTSPAYWTVAKDGNNVYFKSIDSALVLIYKTGVSNPWICVSDKGAVTPIYAEPTFKEMRVDSSGLVQKTYNYDEAFNSKGLVVAAICTSGLGEQSYSISLSSITWATTYVDGTITGTTYFLGQNRDVLVTGLTITNYVYDALVIDATYAQEQYQVGETTNIDGVVVSQHFTDVETFETKEVEIIDRENIVISPAVIAATTTEITLTYKGVSNSYAIVTPEVVKYEIAKSITKGDKVVITGNFNGIQAELTSDGLNATPFTYFPHGKAVWEVMYNTKYPNYVFKLVEVDGEAFTGEKYFARNGTKTEVASSISDLSTWVIGTRDPDYPEEFYFTNLDNGAPLGMNQDTLTPKFTTNPNSKRDDCLTIYRQIA